MANIFLIFLFLLSQIPLHFYGAFSSPALKINVSSAHLNEIQSAQRATFLSGLELQAGYHFLHSSAARAGSARLIKGGDSNAVVDQCAVNGCSGTRTAVEESAFQVFFLLALLTSSPRMSWRAYAFYTFFSSNVVWAASDFCCSGQGSCGPGCNTFYRLYSCNCGSNEWWFNTCAACQQCQCNPGYYTTPSPGLVGGTCNSGCNSCPSGQYGIGGLSACSSCPSGRFGSTLASS